MVEFSQIKGFAFDLDGVITDTAKFHAKAWQQLADEVGTSWTDELSDQLKGINRMDSLEMILKAGGHENDFSKSQKEELAIKKNENYVELIKTLTPDDILPGMLDFIKKIKENGYQLSLASVSLNAPVILKNLGLSDVFEGIVNPASLKNGKPSPEIYLRAAEIMNLEPEEVIGVEDAAAGIKSINDAKETSLGIGNKNELKEADLLFANTKEVTLDAIKEKMNKKTSLR